MPGVDVDKQGVRVLAASIHPRTNGLSAGGARQPVRWPARAQAPPAKPTTKNASSAKGTAVTAECTTETLEHPGSTVRDHQHDSASGIVPEGHDGTLGAKDMGATSTGDAPTTGSAASPRRRNLRPWPRGRTWTRRPCTRRTSR